MPLKKGYSKATVSKNIKTEMAAGKPQVFIKQLLFILLTHTRRLTLDAFNTHIFPTYTNNVNRTMAACGA